MIADEMGKTPLNRSASTLRDITDDNLVSIRFDLLVCMYKK